MSSFVYYAGRTLQLFGMMVLAFDMVSAGPLGPSPRIFAYGVALFIVGWLLVRGKRGTAS
jgi:hypothetical protein